MSVTTLSLDAVGLSARSVNALRRIGVDTVGAMLEYDEERLLRVRNLGQKSVKEILEKIEEYKKLEALGDMLETSEQIENHQIWRDSEIGRKQILEWLQEQQIQIDVLETLSARAYNVLTLNGYTYLHQIAFRTKEDLQNIPRMEAYCAEEIVNWVDAYIVDNLGYFYEELYVKSIEEPITLDGLIISIW